MSINNKKLRLQVQYCGYKRYYHSLKDYFSTTNVAEQLEWVALKDRGVTGNFIVTVLPSGHVLHTNKGGGVKKGKAQTMEERRAILTQIQVLLEDQEEDE